LQFAKAALYSYPYYPDVSAMALALASSIGVKPPMVMPLVPQAVQQQPQPQTAPAMPVSVAQTSAVPVPSVLATDGAKASGVATVVARPGVPLVPLQVAQPGGGSMVVMVPAGSVVMPLQQQAQPLAL